MFRANNPMRWYVTNWNNSRMGYVRGLLTAIKNAPIPARGQLINNLCERICVQPLQVTEFIVAWTDGSIILVIEE